MPILDMKARKRPELLKYLPMVILLGLSLPFSYSTSPIHLETNISQATISAMKQSEYDTTTSGEPLNTRSLSRSNQAPDCEVTTNVVFLSSVTCLISISLLSMIWNYFNNINITKECLLLYVYQDGVAVTMIADVVWLACIISVHTSESGNHVTVFQAKTLSFFIAFLKLEVLLICNTISVIKIYTLKTNVIDPSLPWGENEQDTLRIIRFAGLLITILFVFGMYAAGLHSKLHYTLIGEDTSLQSLDNGPTIFVGIQITLFILPILAACASLWYRKRGEILNRYEVGNNQFPIILISFMTLLAVGIIITIGSNSFQEGCSLLIGQFVIMIGLVVMPFLVIIASTPLRSHCKKVVTNVTKSTRTLVTDAASAFVAHISLDRRFRQIYPLQE